MPPAAITDTEDHYVLPNEENQIQVDNFIGGKFAAPSTGNYLSVLSPSTSAKVGSVGVSASSDVDTAVKSAKNAFASWSSLTMKSRAAIMLKFHALVREHAREIAELIVLENGKNITEALADVAKGNETVEYACSLPQLAQGRILRVSSEVSCQDRRDPLGVVASIVPFNFPFMVPQWTVPIALVMGNTVVLKPSEKVPLTMRRTAELMKEAGIPDGVFNMVQGTKEVVEALIDHEDIRAVTFVGSSPVASIVASRCHSLSKRVTALGGAKNHLVALPDCDANGASSDIVVSYAGCAGQRCMAASVLLTVGQGPKQDELLRKIVEKASKIQPGTEPGKMGSVIDEASYKNIISCIEDSERAGAEILLDGREWANGPMAKKGGCWIGPTVIKHASPEDKCMKEEVFGPVLSVYNVSSWSEAIAIENSNPFGNAACIYTSSGGHADWFTSRFRASMLGINVGIPVPREPFSFGGLYGTKSKYGDMDITGDGAMEFFSNRIKVTSKWPVPNVEEFVTGDAFNANVSGPMDHANFAGRM
uniref:methylmalonate-semialdehyde dehydrogenase (CoA acylating) n=2 Tax=Odontella aurita TaxID=265563 RepID=A0A7S4N738_9STRA